MIRVLVVDDHPVVREGLVAVLGDQPDLDVVGAASSAEAALEQAARMRPDVILLDLELAGQDGVAAMPSLRESGSRVLVFTAYDTDERVFGALEAGAAGYLLKGAPVDEIARAIRAVHAGGSYLAPRVAAKVVGAVGRGRRPAGGLTEREREVLRLVAQGLQNKGPAEQADRAGAWHHRADREVPRDGDPHTPGRRQPRPGGRNRGGARAAVAVADANPSPATPASSLPHRALSS